MDDLLNPPDAAPAHARAGGRNVLQVLWQHRALVLLGLVLGLTLGGLSYAQRPPVYRTSAQLLVVKKQSVGALLTERGDPNSRVVDDYIGAHLFVLRSPALINEAVQKRSLGSLRSLQGGNPAAVIQAGLKAEREVNKDAPAGSTSSIINLSYSGSDPGDCEAILTAVIESYKDFLDRTYKNTAENTVEMVQAEAEKLSKRLDQKNREYAEFLKTGNLLITENGTPFDQAKLAVDQRKVSTLEEKVGALKARVAEVEKAIAEKKPLPLILRLAERPERDEKGDRPAPPKASAAALESAIFQLRLQETELTGFYGKDHPDVARVRQRIEATKEHFKNLDALVAEVKGAPEADPAQVALNALRIDLVLEEGNYKYVKAVFDADMAKAKAQQGLYNEFDRLRDDRSRARAHLDATLKRLQEIDTGRGSGGFNAQAITPPGPGFKVAPVMWQFLLMGAALGCALGSGAAYLLDMADKSFRTPEEIRRRLGLPLVGHVPFVHKPTEPVRVTDAAGNAVELDPGLATVHSPMSPEAEAYRGVRTALFFSTHGERHKVIQVTSPNMGDGKTTLIINLAVSIAQSGRKVLLVDADLRRPRVHRAFGVVGRVGLAEVLTGTAELDEAIQVTAVPNLSVLPCGRRPNNPAELLTAPAFEDALDDLRAAYDYVLVDSPPLLAVSDPCIVAPRVDGLILTIRIAKNGRPAAERARDLLTGLKVNCIGVVVNGVGKQGAMAGYGYDHYRYADEYTSPYTSAEHDEHDAHNTGAAPAPAPAPAPDALEAPPVSRLRPLLNGHAEPSTNGHGHHGSNGHADG